MKEMEKRRTNKKQVQMEIHKIRKKTKRKKYIQKKQAKEIEKKK